MDTNSQQKSGVATKPTRVGVDGFVSARSIHRSVHTAPTRRVVAKPTQLASVAPVAAPKVVKKKIQKRTVVPAVVREPLPAPVYKAPQRPLRVVRHRKPWRKIIFRTSGVLIATFLLTGGFLFWKMNVQLRKVFHGTTTVAALSSKPVDVTQLKGEGDGRVNILLLGVGGDGHEGPDLTDTIIVMSVDPVNNTAALLSVPRDLWVKMPVNYFGNYQKLNAAYESGKYHYLGKMDESNANTAAVEAGFKSIDQNVSEVLGIDIHYHLLVNFKAFQQAIDTVGGVDIDVKEALYDPTMAWENGYNSVLADVGQQTMNGKKALLYVRSRETSSDFARSERQRQVMLGLKSKILSAGTLSNPAKIDGLMNAFGNNVYSDLSTDGAQRLYGIMKKIDNTKVASIGLVQAPNDLVTTDRVGSASVVRPKAGFNNYSDIQTYVRSQLVDGYIAKEHASVTVVSSTLTNAATISTDLKSYGYNVTSTLTTTNTSTQPTVVDLSGGTAKYTRNYLEKRYGVHAVSTVPAGIVIPPGSAKFVIISSK